MGVKLKNLDPGHPARKWICEFSNTAVAIDYFINVPYNCTFAGITWGAASASSGLAIGVSNINSTDAIVSGGHIYVSASNDTIAAGTIKRFPASSTFYITANSILRVDVAASSNEAAIAVEFNIDDNKEI